jgi:hypothetical protein
MARLLYNIMLGYVCFSLASFVLFQSQIIPYSLPVGWQPISSSNNIIADLFSINAFTVLLGIGGGIAIGIVGFLLKQGINAVYALTIFVFGVVFTPVQQLVTSLPITLALFFTGDLSYLAVVITSIVGFAVFIFFVELLANRNVS